MAKAPGLYCSYGLSPFQTPLAVKQLALEVIHYDRITIREVAALLYK